MVGDTTSAMTFRNMVDGKGEATFNGRVLIRKDSQRSATEQSIANLLLSKNARVNPKPELEIYADDVTASHGCTVGSLSKTELFYLKSRGLSETDARASQMRHAPCCPCTRLSQTWTGSMRQALHQSGRSVQQ